ncbi:acetate--CoA ligase family protein [Yeosuana marina]|uniref:acetate--CoA ligase family protein n=1 Tax=Yeosuana marina TaxID=1565536 RepID=UPI0030EEF1AE|tara:strand:- start:12227 stop:14287 length:2061 start_codon:yes stop_codon:yes gene_type:complete
MLHPKLVHPESIVVIGGSDNIQSPGGRVLKNLIEHKFKGDLFVVNPKQDSVQGIKSFNNVEVIPKVDLAIIAIPAHYILEPIKILTQQKNTKGFIIFSAGFGEKDAHGAFLEKEIVQLIDEVGGSLLGPNNIGLINQYYAGVFTRPIPKLSEFGVDFISGSGATAVFIIEAAVGMGLTFSSVYTVGNSAQIGVEELLEFLDESFDSKVSSKVKLLYIESIKNPIKFLKHTSSLIKKGCKIAAIKAGSTEAGIKAASSHTGALATSDVFIDALFKKAGIIRCYGRNELITVAGILLQKESIGKNIAIITHAGGPAVMLTDILSKNGLNIPSLKGSKSETLLEELFDGSSVANPIDFLATGTAEQLDIIIDYCDNQFENIDAMVVIFGSPGLKPVYDVYDVLNKKIKTSKKPIYAILPSIINVQDEINEFISKGNIAFSDEVLFGKALASVYNQNSTQYRGETLTVKPDKNIRDIIDGLPNGYMPTDVAIKILCYAGIECASYNTVKNKEELLIVSKSLQYPVVEKVIGPLHKSDVNGVLLNISNEKELIDGFEKLITIDGAQSVLIQPMINGMELFVGAKQEGSYPPIVLCGLGGIFVEVLKDVSASMIPISSKQALEMINSLKAYPIFKGIRGHKGINIGALVETIVKVSNLLSIAPEITDLDINPLLASENKLISVDARICIKRG